MLKFTRNILQKTLLLRFNAQNYNTPLNQASS